MGKESTSIWLYPAHHERLARIGAAMGERLGTDPLPKSVALRAALDRGIAALESEYGIAPPSHSGRPKRASGAHPTPKRGRRGG